MSKMGVAFAPSSFVPRPLSSSSASVCRTNHARSSSGMLPWSPRRRAILTTCTAAAPDLSPEKAAASVVTSPDLGGLRIGHGYDLHRLEAGLPLILGGINLPHSVGCAGHSDGDAIYHCVVDAILGALSLPDIGQLFPDSDPRFKGCASDVFMTAAYARLHLAGYAVGNLDVTVILEKPKLSPHKLAIRENISRLLNAPLSSINLKAKTHEKVDAVGENRAVEVHAVVLLVKNGPAYTPHSPYSTPAMEPVDVGKASTETLLKSVTNRAAAINDIISSSSSLDGGTSASAANSSCAVQKLYEMVSSRRGADAASSWTAKLFEKGRSKIAQKVGEEAVEVVIEAMKNDVDKTVSESADLLYHLCVLWADMEITPQVVFKELARREGTSGIKEKASRKK